MKTCPKPVFLGAQKNNKSIYFNAISLCSYVMCVRVCMCVFG